VIAKGERVQGIPKYLAHPGKIRNLGRQPFVNLVQNLSLEEGIPSLSSWLWLLRVLHQLTSTNDVLHYSVTIIAILDWKRTSHLYAVTAHRLLISFGQHLDREVY